MAQSRPNPRRTNGYKRDKVRAQVLREETNCAICGLPVDKTLPPHQPGSPEVDEIVQVQHGGDPYDRANCRLTHRRCNRYRDVGKGNTPSIKRVRTY